MITAIIVIYDNKFSENHTDQNVGSANRLLGDCWGWPTDTGSAVI